MLKYVRPGCGETALHFLAIENDLDGVRWLQEKGFSIDTVDACGEPVIFVVARLGYKELFSWFVSKGANLGAKNREGMDLISHLIEFDKDDMAGWIESTYPSVVTCRQRMPRMAIKPISPSITMDRDQPVAAVNIIRRCQVA